MNAKKLTCGRRFWHGLHGLKIKGQTISPEWTFTSSKEYFSLSYPYVAFQHGLHGLTNKVSESAKKLTCGRRFWHGLHGLKIKVLKIPQGWPFVSNSDLIFSN